MAVTKPVYSSTTAITISLNSLANGAARECTVIDNGTTRYLDAHLKVVVSVGAVAGAPQVLIYTYGSEDGSIFPDQVTGADAGISLENPTVLHLAKAFPTPTGSKVYESDLIPIARLYGGLALPRKWGIVVVNQTGAAFAGSGNSAAFTGITLETL